jgi:hypothetical protein
MDKHLKELLRQPLKFRIPRLLLAGVSVCLASLSLGAYTRAVQLGMWFHVGLNALAVLVNVFALLVNLGVWRLPSPKPRHVQREILIMQVYPPLAADHPLVTDEKEHCCLCEQRFKSGETTTLVSKERPVIGEAVVEALPAHAGCVQVAMTQGQAP